MSNDSTRQHLIGTWKLITAVREEISSGTKTEFLGPSPVGYINYGADGRMLVLTVASGRRKPAGPKATSAEVEALFRSMTSYGGTYTIDGNEITHHVEHLDTAGHARTQNPCVAPVSSAYLAYCPGVSRHGWTRPDRSPA